MSHREKSLTPWITKHGFERVVLPQPVYDRAVAEGCDMTHFIRQEKIPTDEVEYHHGRRNACECGEHSKRCRWPSCGSLGRDR